MSTEFADHYPADDEPKIAPGEIDNALASMALKEGQGYIKGEATEAAVDEALKSIDPEYQIVPGKGNFQLDQKERIDRATTPMDKAKLEIFYTIQNLPPEIQPTYDKTERLSTVIPHLVVSLNALIKKNVGNYENLIILRKAKQAVDNIYRDLTSQ